MINKEYWGINTVNYTEKELVELVEKIVFPLPEDNRYYNLFSEESTQNQLTNDDKSALVKYAPKLFITFIGSMTIRFPAKLFDLKWSSNFRSLTLKDFQYQYTKLTKLHQQSIEDAIFRLVKYVWEYRLHQSPHYAINYITDNNFNRYAKDKKKKIESFQNTIDSLIELMGGNFSSGIPKDPNMPKLAELKDMLKYAKEHSDIYLPSKPKVSTNKNIFKDYLKGLNIEGKSDEIEAFSKCIK